MISSVDLRRITTLIFDIDGTLTDGRLGWEPGGETIKFFDAHDTHWLKLAMRAGLTVGVLSGLDDAPNRRLVREENFNFAVLGVKDKLAAFTALLDERSLTAEECLYVGDDVVDMPVLRRAGVGAVVADAAPELAEVASWRTHAAGGRGAAMEIVRTVLREKGLLDSIMERYRR